jgi:hypothetical protein
MKLWAGLENYFILFNHLFTVIPFAFREVIDFNNLMLGLCLWLMNFYYCIFVCFPATNLFIQFFFLDYKYC